MNRFLLLPVFSIFFIFSFLSPAFSQEESITITTYYPAPYGTYKEMRAKKMAVGGTYVENSKYCWGASCGATIAVIPDDADLVVEGSVGIGTTNILSPFKLAVRGEAEFNNPVGYGAISIVGAGDGLLYGALDLSSNTTGDTWGIQYRQDTGNLGFTYFPTSQYPLQLTRSGNVGIGTATPGTKLDVSGTARMTGFQLGTSTTAGYVLTANASGVGTWAAPGGTISSQRYYKDAAHQSITLGVWKACFLTMVLTDGSPGGGCQLFLQPSGSWQLSSIGTSYSCSATCLNW
jgi:hypothetical protein